MLSKDDAVQLITSRLDEIYKDFVGGVAIIPEATIEKPYGWVFFHNSKKYGSPDGSVGAWSASSLIARLA
jgi:hypothetical protein